MNPSIQFWATHLNVLHAQKLAHVAEEPLR